MDRKVIEIEEDEIETQNPDFWNNPKKAELLLADGTKVWLNAGSRLAFPQKFIEKKREVFLEGEAYFEAAKNETQPFIVNTGQLNIKVIGTHFNVSAYPSDNNIETVLLEGSVVVSRPTVFGLKKEEVTLKPDQKALFDVQNNIISVSDVPDAGMYISWTTGWLEFSKESLHSVFNQLERYYNVKITIPPNFPYPELISGKLDLKDSLEDVMIALGDVSNIVYRINKLKNQIEVFGFSTYQAKPF